MTKRNPNFARLTATYLFPEIARRKKAFLAQHPKAALINLGVGDTTTPIVPYIAEALTCAAARLGTQEGYSGYGPEHGIPELRRHIAQQIYGNKVSQEDVFISDGAKCDIGRLQKLFGPNASIAVQDPTYPVYLDGSLLEGVSDIKFLPCAPENNFWPDWQLAPRTDLIYWCSPNNPTGIVATHAQLKELVAFAKHNRSIILFDAAYANYIQDASLPRSIYEIAGADEVAIEIGSFSKLAGFSGIRLGWTVVPQGLKYEDGLPVKADWQRLTSTIFNGASNISQQGGLAVLQPQGMQEVKAVIRFYLENVALLKEALQARGFTVFGGEHAPYLWTKFPGYTSWQAFQLLLEKSHLITTPGSGFGPQGEGFLRLSAFSQREDILEAAARLSKIG